MSHPQSMLAVREEKTELGVRTLITLVGDVESLTSHQIHFSEISSAYGWRFGIQQLYTKYGKKVLSYQSTFISLDMGNVAHSLVGQEVAIKVRRQWEQPSLFIPTPEEDQNTNIVAQKSIVQPIFSYHDGLHTSTKIVVDIQVVGGEIPTVVGVTSSPLSVSHSDTEWKFNGPRDTLVTSLKTGSFFDVMFLAFTRRESTTSTLLRPAPIYATVRVLEDMGVDMTSDKREVWSQVSPGDASSRYERYDYEEDSDLDEDEPQIVEELVSNPSDDHVSAARHSPDYVREERSSEDVSCPPPYLGYIHHPQDRNQDRNLPTYLVTGAAHKTWNALVYYCYTKEVNFASLVSVGARPDDQAVAQAPVCSPKSMYRLAMKLNLPALAEVALHNFESQLSAKNILDESLTKFAAAYPRVRDITTDLLLEHRNTPEVLQSLPGKIREMLRGDMPHVEPVLFALLSLHPTPPAKKTWSQ